jgi:hypothetical protein
METTANTPDYGYITAYAGGGSVRHIVKRYGAGFNEYKSAAVCGTKPAARWGAGIRWTSTEVPDIVYPTPAAALEARPNVCKRCSAAVARMTEDETAAPVAPAAPKVSPRRQAEIQAGFMVDTPAAPALDENNPGTWTSGDTADYEWRADSRCEDGELHYTRVSDGHCLSCAHYAAAASSPDEPAPAPSRETHDIVAAWKFVSESYDPYSPNRPDWTDEEIFDFVAVHHVGGLDSVKLTHMAGNIGNAGNRPYTALCEAPGGERRTNPRDVTCTACKEVLAARAAEFRAAELVKMSDYPAGERVELDPATAPSATYRTARAVVTAYYRGGPGRAGCIDSVIILVLGGDSHPARNFAALDALSELQGRVSENVTAGGYQTIPRGERGTIFVYGSWNN